jgi:hypothetical protein
MKMRMIIAVFAVLVLCAGSAIAESESYVVKKGDTLSGIAQKYHSNWKEMAKENNLANPNLIFPGQRIQVKAGLKRGTLENPSMYTDSKVGADPYKGSLDEALVLLGAISKGERFQARRLSGDEGWDTISSGEIIKMVSGRRKVGIFIVALKDSRALAAKKYIVTRADGTEFPVWLNMWCGNWLIKITPPETPPGEVEPPQITPVPAPPELIQTPPGVEEEPTPTLPPEVEEPPEEEAPPPFIEEEEEVSCPPEHQPIAGAGAWNSGIAKGNFYFGEHMTYFKRNCGSEYSYGAGFYVIGEDGDSKLSAYEWWGKGYGPQVGVKKYSLRKDKNGKYLAHQVELKVRFIREYVSGGNSASGYQMSQKGWKAGIYLEKVDELSDKWKRIITAEGWWNFDRHITTTWRGDTPANRSQAMLSVYGQYKINDTWQTRIGGGLFYQAWDREAGLHLRAELRYNEWLMLGPYANVFFWKTAVYEGIPLRDLQTIGGFVRVEAGVLIREWDRQRRMERIKQLDDEKYGVIVLSQGIDKAQLPAIIQSQADSSHEITEKVCCSTGSR